MAKKKRGAPFKYTPEEFELAWQQYFEWSDSNPWYKNEAVKSGDRAGQIIAVPTVRPYTELGFCVFHDLGEKYLTELGHTLQGREDKKCKELSNILARARAKCYNQKFEGAAVGAFNANIIARVLGLTDKQEVKNNNVNYNTDIKVSEEEAKAIHDAIMKNI